LKINNLSIGERGVTKGRRIRWQKQLKKGGNFERKKRQASSRCTEQQASLYKKKNTTEREIEIGDAAKKNSTDRGRSEVDEFGGRGQTAEEFGKA